MRNYPFLVLRKGSEKNILIIKKENLNTHHTYSGRSTTGGRACHILDKNNSPLRCEAEQHSPFPLFSLTYNNYAAYRRLHHPPPPPPPSAAKQKGTAGCSEGDGHKDYPI